MPRLDGFVVTLFVVAVIGSYTALGGPDRGLVLLLPALVVLAGLFDAHLELLEDNEYRPQGAGLAGIVAGMGAFVLTVAIVSRNLLGILSGSGLVLSSLIALEVAMERLSPLDHVAADALLSNHVLNGIFFATGVVTVVPTTLLLVGYQPVLIALMLVTLFTVTAVAFVYNERTRREAMDAVHEIYQHLM